MKPNSKQNKVLEDVLRKAIAYGMYVGATMPTDISKAKYTAMVKESKKKVSELIHELEGAWPIV